MDSLSRLHTISDEQLLLAQKAIEEEANRNRSEPWKFIAWITEEGKIDSVEHISLRPSARHLNHQQVFWNPR